MRQPASTANQRLRPVNGSSAVRFVAARAPLDAESPCERTTVFSAGRADLCRPGSTGAGLLSVVVVVVVVGTGAGCGAG